MTGVQTCALPIYSVSESLVSGQLPEGYQNAKGSLITKFSPAGEIIWAKRIDGPDGTDIQKIISTTNDSILAICSDSNGLNQTLKKYDSHGDLVFNVAFDQFKRAKNLAVDKNGYIYTAGSTTVNASGNINPNSGYPLITKFSPDGLKIWETSYANDVNNCGLYSISIDDSGSIFVSGSINFPQDNPNLFGYQDIFLSKLSNNGEKIWSRNFGQLPYGANITNMPGDNIKISKDGSIFLTIDTNGAYDPYTNVGGFDTYLAKFDSNGQIKYMQQVGTQGDDFSGGLDISKPKILELEKRPSEFDCDLLNIENAKKAILIINSGLDSISSLRANMGAVMNRLEHVVDNLTDVSMNEEASRSQIEDADYASASTELARTQIMQQASTAVLAQANVDLKMVLKLLNG